MKVTYMPTVKFKDLEEAYREMYEEELHLSDFEWETYCNDCYKEYSVACAFDLDATELQKNLSYLFLKEGISVTSDVLIDISW